MKKITLFMSLIMLGTIGFGQVIFQVQSPATATGSFGLTWAEPAGGDWSTPDLNDVTNSVTDTLMFVDFPGGDTIACSPPLAADLTSKIAVLYRGDCEFGFKVLAAQNAGALAVIIINNVGGLPVAMGGGADGLSDTIPVIMISDVDGAALRDQIRMGDVVGFIGSKNGLFANDLGASSGDIVRARRFSNISMLSQNASEFSIPTGTWVTNIGSETQFNVDVSVDVSFGGSSLYTNTVSLDSLSSDTANSRVFVTLGTFSQASYPVGTYNMTYTISAQDPDEDPFDNVIETSFMINDSIYSYGSLDPVTKEPLSPARGRPGTFNNAYEMCLAFEDPNASRVAATGMTFSATTDDSDLLTGEFVEMKVYQWDNVFTDINDAAFDLGLLVEVKNNFFVYGDDDQDVNIFVPFVDFDNNSTPLLLNDNQKYLFCFTTVSQTLFLGFDNALDYTTTQGDAFLQASFPLDVDADDFLNGFGLDLAPAISVTMVDATTVGIEEKESKAKITPFPNPVQNVINIPVGQLSGTGQLEIMDLTGRLVNTQSLSFGTNDVLKVDVSSVTNGTYIFKLRLDDGTTSKFNVIITK